MSVETGEYIIVNARYHNLAYLPEAKNGTPVVAKYKQNDAYEKWFVRKSWDGSYTIKSVANNMFAVAGKRAGQVTIVEGGSSSQQWIIQKIGVRGHYTISTPRTGSAWGLEDDRTQFGVVLAYRSTDTRMTWIFEQV